MTCEIQTINGSPRLCIDGIPQAPVLFFGNTDIGKNVTEQVEMAAQNGIHLHSVIYNLHFSDEKPGCCEADGADTQDEIRDLRRCLDMVLDGDNEAKIFLRVKVGAYFKEAPDEWKDELIVFKDGSIYPEGSNLCLVSTSSDKWADAVDFKLRKIIDYMLSDKLYKDHIACIHLENCEWFEYGFRESGSDMSTVADSKFKRWQSEKYGPDYQCVPVPRDLPNNISSQLYKNTLLMEAQEQRFVDYFDFINDLVSSRIERFGKTIKEVSEKKLLVIAFYGYLFELADCQSGHYKLQRLLKSPYIHGFAGPVSYGDRSSSSPHGAVGATSAYMTVMDSIARNGKMWFQESDQRTFVNGSPDGAWLPNIKTINDIINVHRREVGDIILHDCGIWAMDLCATGWLLDNTIWEKLSQLKRLYERKITQSPPRSCFDIVFVVDEAAESVVGQPSFNGISANLLYNMRYEAYRSGTSFSFAEINDVADGLFDDAKLYIFLNPYRISHETALKLKQSIWNKNALWMYGFGATSPEDVKLLTGMDIALCGAGSTLIQTQRKPFTASPEFCNVTHRYVIASGYDEVLGTYDNGQAAFAVRQEDCGCTYFWGGVSLGRENIRAFASECRLHVYSLHGDVTMTDNNTLIYCATEGGTKKISLPVGYSAEVDGKQYTALDGFIEFQALPGETKYIKLH